MRVPSDGRSGGLGILGSVSEVLAMYRSHFIGIRLAVQENCNVVFAGILP